MSQEKVDDRPSDSDQVARHDGVTYDEAGLPVCPSSTTERKLMWKIDLHVIPWLCIMYLLAFLDRVNISNANVFDLSVELGLEHHQFNTALVIFFVPYILFEIPSNVLLKHFKPHVWLSINMFAFGLVTLLQGLVTSYSGLLATRFFLGLFESSMFPASFYLIGMWYRRREAQRRYSFFFNSTTLAGAFGGLLAAAIGKMGNIGLKLPGITNNALGWRWIFILEGALTVLVSFALFFLLPDFPEDVKWLTAEERAYMKAKIAIDQGDSGRHRKTTLKSVGRVLKDYKIILGGFMYFGLIVPAYGYAYFAPGIIRTYGYSPIQTQLHSVPPWVAAFGFSMAIAFASDYFVHRVGFLMFTLCVAITGFSILISVHDNTDLQYGALFLVTCGAYTSMPLIVSWFNMNIGGHTRRAVGSAWQVGFGNIGGIIASFTFLPGDAPKFVTGYSICIAFTILSMAASIIYGFCCWNDNRRKDARVGDDHGLTEDEKAEMGDHSPDYRYML
ncbi:MFS general substrate transporter [Sarocladium strictum]